MGNFKTREFRKAKGIYQSEMAEILGLTQPNLSRYENNAIDLTDEMLDRLREKYSKEDVDAYLTDSMEQVRDKEVPLSRADELAFIDMVTIIKRQNETICQQVEAQKELTNQLAQINARLLDILEKMQFD